MDGKWKPGMNNVDILGQPSVSKHNLWLNLTKVLLYCRFPTPAVDFSQFRNLIEDHQRVVLASCLPGYDSWLNLIFLLGWGFQVLSWFRSFWGWHLRIIGWLGFFSFQQFGFNLFATGSLCAINAATWTYYVEQKYIKHFPMTHPCNYGIWPTFTTKDQPFM